MLHGVGFFYVYIAGWNTQGVVTPLNATIGMVVKTPIIGPVLGSLRRFFTLGIWFLRSYGPAS